MPDSTDPIWSRLDGCPECVRNVEAPHRWHGRTAFYRCTDCGHEWSTSWGI